MGEQVPLIVDRRGNNWTRGEPVRRSVADRLFGKDEKGTKTLT